MPINSFKALACAALLFSGAAEARKKPLPDYSPALPPMVAPQASPGAIFPGASYVALTNGARAGGVGDILTIVLAERTQAIKANSAQTARDGSLGLTPPTTGPLSLFKPSDIGAGGNQAFKGSGTAAQSNALTGEITVTIVEVRPNGTALVRGQKSLTLNRGDEVIQLSGIVRLADIGPDNRVLSTRIADARIGYTGRGEIARGSKQGWLQRFFSVVSPF